MRLSGSLRFDASSWSVGSIWDKCGPPTKTFIINHLQMLFWAMLCREFVRGSTGVTRRRSSETFDMANGSVSVGGAKAGSGGHAGQRRMAFEVSRTLGEERVHEGLFEFGGEGDQGAPAARSPTVRLTTG